MYLVWPFPPASHALASPATIAPRSIDGTQCGFQGNNDIYGVGIRVGLYAQILAVWFANYFLFSKAQVLRDSVSIFSVALLIIALISAANPQDVYAIEGFILLQMLAWSCLMGVRANSSHAKGILSNGSLFRKGVCEIVNLVNIILHVWFWWVGIDHMKTMPCGTHVLLYVLKTDMFGWARKAMMTMSLLFLLCTVYWTSVGLPRSWAMWRISTARQEFAEAVRIWETLDSKTLDHVITLEPKAEDTGCGCGCDNMDDACSRRSCVLCSPIESHFGFDRGTEPTSHFNAPLPISTDEIDSAKSIKLSFEQEADGSTAEPTILLEVYESEVYIQHCISASPYQVNADGRPTGFAVIIKSILFPARYRIGACTNGLPSWFQCYFKICMLLLTCRFPPQALAVYSHLRQSRLLDPLNGPFQLYAAVTYKPAGGRDLPNWSSVSLASSLLLAEANVPKRVGSRWYYMSLDLVIHIIVILQVELTLDWNNVRGSSGSFMSVGQLIPFIVGVGGLLFVGSGWSMRAWKKWKKGADASSGWERNDVLAGENNTDEKCGESFGLGEDISRYYASWRESRKGLLSSRAQA
ncbi:hypothetical protein C7974DRAFT_182332 [Boeremia exigua]|uniref:uncharacterized protein n=1 Tax=Boeremia exigua TaxID=749465 RepID=UPI001E8ED253|nr:uncharacterized protein C7974DRAFT_182332 [Boeremia exigua]KAH6629161.1 hypothetical protein C7974DRAFT_182332 [Boeremia exigua]